MIADVNNIKQHENLLDIDNNLDILVKRIELLSYVNPLNIEKEKQRFFSSRCTVEPIFKYPKLKFNPYKLQRLFFSQRLERIENPDIAGFYEDIVYYYANMIQCIDSIGQGKKFYYNSLRTYGTPKERDVQNAKFILHFENEEDSQDLEKKYTPQHAKTYFEEYAKQYNFPLNIKFATHMAADAMVSNINKTLLIKKSSLFSENQLKTLANHEIGVHLVTTYNGLNQPLKVFSNGFPNNVKTQEGLVVLSEYMSGALTLKRLKELAYRVIAVDSLIKGYSFADTFDLIHNQYKLNRDDAFTVTLRVHRGGGFTKDYMYLAGLKEIYNHYLANKDLNILLTGKVSLEYASIIERLQNLKLANPSIHITDSYAQNSNRNKKLDFILQNLK